MKKSVGYMNDAQTEYLAAKSDFNEPRNRYNKASSDASKSQGLRNASYITALLGAIGCGVSFAF